MKLTKEDLEAIAFLNRIVKNYQKLLRLEKS